MYQLCFHALLIIFGWYMIHNAFTDPQISIRMNRNNTYVIRGDQYARFESDILNRSLNCTLNVYHDMNDIDILIYRHYTGYYDIFNRTIRYNYPLIDKFYSGDMIKHIGFRSDSLLIECEMI